MSRTITEILNTTDHYETLGVSKTATIEEITNSYKRLAKQYHPDRCNLDHAEDAFKKIGTAYEVLKNSERRRLYDLSFTDRRYIDPTPTQDFDPTEQIFRNMFTRQRQYGNTTFYYASTPFGTYTSANYGRPQRPQRDAQPARPANSLYVILLVAFFIFVQMAISRFNSPLEYSTTKAEPYTYAIPVHYADFHDEFYIRPKDATSLRLSHTADSYLTFRLQEIATECKILRSQESRFMANLRRGRAVPDDYLKLDFTYCAQVGLGGPLYNIEDLRRSYGNNKPKFT